MTGSGERAWWPLETLTFLDGATCAQPAGAIKLADAGEHKLLCDAACEESIAGAEPTSTPSGLRFVDITEGNGAAPLPGDQVSMNTVGSIDKGPPYGAVIFEDSLDRGSPIDIRVGTEEPLLIKGRHSRASGAAPSVCLSLFFFFSSGATCTAPHLADTDRSLVGSSTKGWTR